MSKKKGPLSERECARIKALYSTAPVETIAAELGRTAAAVEKYINENLRAQPAKPPEQLQEAAIKHELKSSKTWKILKEELTEDELGFFEENFVKWKAQFGDDILPSEETQIMQAIKLEVLMSRNLKEKKQALEDIAKTHRTLQDFILGFASDPSSMSEGDKEYARDLDIALKELRAGEKSRSDEYVKLQGEHASLLKAQKATRDQRISKIQDKKIDLLGVIRDLASRDAQEREGRRIELMKLAGKKEGERLGKPIQYDDGAWDRPILSADTVDSVIEETEEASAAPNEE